MGQHKFEEQISRKLRDREINPSPKAWEKLNDRLEKESNKSRSYYWVAGIAASLAAGFLILSLVFNTSIVEDTPVLVETPVESKEKTGKSTEITTENETSVGNNDIHQVAAEETKKAVPGNVEKPKVDAVAATKPFKEEVSPAEKLEVVQQEKDVEELLMEDETILPKRLEEIIAEISTEVNSEADITEAEIDALLYKAATEISLEREREELNNRIDATALLMEVERELDQSFREKVFDILKDGYLKARTAVANRNF